MYITIEATCGSNFELTLWDRQKVLSYNDYPPDVPGFVGNGKLHFKVDLKTGHIIGWSEMLADRLLDELNHPDNAWSVVESNIPVED